MKKIIIILILFVIAVTNIKSQTGVTSYPMPAGLSSPKYNIKIDGVGNKWVAFGRMGLGKFDGASWTIFDTLNSTIPSNQIHDIAFDVSNNVWVTTKKGLAKFDGTTWTIFNVLNSGLPDDSTTCVTIDNSDIWNKLLKKKKYH